MTLVELIKYLESETQLQKLYQEINLDTESEAVLAYMKDSLNLNSDIEFFSIECTDDEIEFEKDGIKYYQLFPLEYGVEIYSYFDDEFRRKKYSDIDKAKRVLDYIVNDA
ncbi:hypothetical protein ACFSC6_06450 [Rufibacter sediminis]|uniref:Uncharacterized protein n=1 Tax=Rufibacter sediminis TaxID=2762756 RepID=A0ABR6VN53_9BACT|nr:hypothetical protein [Rufibacter sediminis]MBC3538585.1 hypothetical protein [Rufibacter sediminis]